MKKKRQKDHFEKNREGAGKTQNRSKKEIGLPENLRVINSEESNPHDG